MVLWFTCGLAPVQAKMLMGLKYVFVSHKVCTCILQHSIVCLWDWTLPEFLKRDSWSYLGYCGTGAWPWKVYHTCSTLLAFDCRLDVSWAILGAEISKNLFSSIGLCTWRNIQHRSDLILLTWQQFEGNRVIWWCGETFSGLRSPWLLQTLQLRSFLKRCEGEEICVLDRASCVRNVIVLLEDIAVPPLCAL